MSPQRLTWLITGTSSGFGSIFVQKIIARGDRIIATARSISKIQGLREAGAAILELDVTAPQSVLDAKAEEAIAIYGGIDVMVNNAGYVELGTLEDVAHEQWLEQYNTNVFGLVNVTRSFMPHFRGRRSGTVLFIGSMAGWRSMGAGGPYCSSKFALEGIAEAFREEAAPIGIKSMMVEPGYFRTKLLTSGNSTLVPTKHAEYEQLTKELYGHMNSYSEKQAGDPEKGVDRILDVVRQEGDAAGRGIPERLVLGNDALAVVRKKCLDTLELLKAWEDISGNTEFAEGE